MEERLSAAGGELLAEVRAGVATATLHRPRALNALSLAMIEALAEWLEAWAGDPGVRVVVLRGAGDKAFCAGGDVRALYAQRERDPEANRRFMAIEYALDHRIHSYPKPVVALLDGIVMGGGMGLAQGATLRVVGDRTRMAMPETAIGLFPDVGGSYFLSRTPGRLGAYLGLAGPTLGAADALYAGLACAYVAPAAWQGFEGALAACGAAGDPFGAVRALAPPHEPGMLPAGELERLRPAIDRHFGAGSVARILASLAGEREHPQWAARTRAALERASPTMLAVTHEQLRRGARLPLADCFRMELGMVYACFEHGDVFEGIRAALVDKDNAPRWRPARLADVRPEDVERFFQPRWPAAQHPLAGL